MKQLFKPAALLTTVLLTVACGGGNTNQHTATPDHSQHTPHNTTETPGATVSSGPIVIESNDQMQFNKNEIKVKAGEEVTITLKHVGKMDKEIMGHNLVVLKPGTDATAFGLEAVNAKDTEYIPSSLASSVIAHSQLIGGGEETSFQITLETGKYDFICSFPGHIALMKGVIVAE